MPEPTISFRPVHGSLRPLRQWHLERFHVTFTPPDGDENVALSPSVLPHHLRDDRRVPMLDDIHLDGQATCFARSCGLALASDTDGWLPVNAADAIERVWAQNAALESGDEAQVVMLNELGWDAAHPDARNTVAAVTLDHGANVAVIETEHPDGVSGTLLTARLHANERASSQPAKHDENAVEFDLAALFGDDCPLQGSMLMSRDQLERLVAQHNAHASEMQIRRLAAVLGREVVDVDGAPKILPSLDN